MIREFSEGRRFLFFPIRWANAVSRWIAGIHSKSGTIRVSNTLSPGKDGSVSLDVDVNAVADKVKSRLGFDRESPINRDGVKHIVYDLADGASIIVSGRRISVSRDWLEGVITQSGSSAELSDSDPKDVGTSASEGTDTAAARADHVHALNCGDGIGTDTTDGTVSFKVKCKSGGGITATSDGVSLAALTPNKWMITDSYGYPTVSDSDPIVADENSTGLVYNAAGTISYKTIGSTAQDDVADAATVADHESRILALEGGGSGGDDDAVYSVNGVFPGNDGNVTLSAGDITCMSNESVQTEITDFHIDVDDAADCVTQGVMVVTKGSANGIAPFTVAADGTSTRYLRIAAGSTGAVSVGTIPAHDIVDSNCTSGGQCLAYFDSDGRLAHLGNLGITVGKANAMANAFTFTGSAGSTTARLNVNAVGQDTAPTEAKAIGFAANSTIASLMSVAVVDTSVSATDGTALTYMNGKLVTDGNTYVKFTSTEYGYLYYQPDSAGGCRLVGYNKKNTPVHLDANCKIPIEYIPTGRTSTTVSLGNHSHSGYASTEHAHGYIKSAGILYTSAGLVTDCIVVTDSSGYVTGDSTISRKALKATLSSVTYNSEASDPTYIKTLTVKSSSSDLGIVLDATTTTHRIYLGYDSVLQSVISCSTAGKLTVQGKTETIIGGSTSQVTIGHTSGYVTIQALANQAKLSAAPTVGTDATASLAIATCGWVNSNCLMTPSSTGVLYAEGGSVSVKGIGSGAEQVAAGNHTHAYGSASLTGFGTAAACSADDFASSSEFDELAATVAELEAGGGEGTGAVTSVNGQTGAVSLDADDVGALDSDDIGTAGGVQAYSSKLTALETSLDANGKVPLTQLSGNISGHSGNCFVTIDNSGNLNHSTNAFYNALNAVFTDYTENSNSIPYIKTSSLTGVVYANSEHVLSSISSNVTDSQTLNVVTQVLWNSSQTALQYKYVTLTISHGVITNISSASTGTIDSPTLINWS